MLRSPAAWPAIALLCGGLAMPADRAFADDWQPDGGVDCSGDRCQLWADTSRPRERGAAARESERIQETRQEEENAPTGARQDAVEEDAGNGAVRDCVTPVFRRGLRAEGCYGAEVEQPGQQSPAAGTVSVEELGGLAVEELRLPSPAIRTNPSAVAVQMVRVPTWLWLDPDVWAPVTETVSAPGLSVTATARPVRVVWSMGDGGRVVCEGPGTPYTSAFGPDAASPDCGYTFTRSSMGQPGGVFTVSAAITWDVVWEGGGQSGRVPGLTTVDEVDLTVDEIQALVVNHPDR